MSIFDKGYSFKVAKDADGKPATITDVKDGIMDVAIGAVTSIVDDATVVTGVGRAAQGAVSYYAGRQIENAVMGKPVQLKAWNS